MAVARALALAVQLLVMRKRIMQAMRLVARQNYWLAVTRAGGCPGLFIFAAALWARSKWVGRLERQGWNWL